MRRAICIVLSVLTMMIIFSGCTREPKETDGAVGEYLFVYEKAPLAYHENLDYKMILDGYGGGEYHKNNNVHKIKYTYDEPNIVITDNMTGIKYKGTLENGKLLLYDGSKTDAMTSEFLFESKYSH